MLSLKSDFVETICHVYLEKHQPYKYQKLLQIFATRQHTATREKEEPSTQDGDATNSKTQKVNDDKQNHDLTPTSSEINIPAQVFVDEALAKCTLYELLNSKEGFLTLQNYFIKAALLLDRDSGLTEQGQHFLGAGG